MTYFDNAATTFPKPSTVICAMNQCMLHYAANPGRSGHNLSMRAAEEMYNVREAAADFFAAASVDQVIFTLNCTHGLNIVFKGVLSQGDHVIISDLEHNAVLRPIHGLAARGVITYDIAQTYPDDEETVASFRKLIKPQTRMIVATHASNVFGIQLPVTAIGQLAKEYNLLFVVDGAQTAGVLPIHMENMGISFLSVAGHKSLYGPMGTGLLILGEKQNCSPLMEGGTGSHSADFLQPDFLPDALESGTSNLPGAAGLGAGLHHVVKTGVDNIYAREMKIISLIYECLCECPKVELYVRPVFGRTVPVLSFNLEGMTGEQTAAKLNQMGFALRGGLQCAPLAHRKFGTLERGTARISIGCYNTMEEAMCLCHAIKNVKTV